MVWSGSVAASFLLALWLVVRPVDGRNVQVVRFQTGDVATTESFLDTGLEGLPALRQVTMLVHLRLRRVTSHIPLLNYAIEGSNEELFVELVPKKKDMHVQCCRGLVSEAFKFKLKMFTWQHICVSLNLDNGVLRVIYDELEYQVNIKVPTWQLGPDRPLEVRPGGRLVVGQKLYSMDGDFIVLEHLDGEIGDYRIYDVALQFREMKQLLACWDMPEIGEPIVNLEGDVFQLRGPTVAREMELTEMCGNHVTDFYLFFPQKTIFEHAYSWCRKLKGNLILPEDPDTNHYFFDTFVSYKDQCDDIWTHLYWIGGGGNLTTRQWLKLTDGTEVTWHPFLREYRTVTPEFQCIGAVTHDRYKWAACPCDIETCVLCNFTTHPEMRLRGLCKDSALDRLFSFRDNEEFELVFDGLAHVVMQQRNGTWIMRSRLYEHISATMIAQWYGQYPVGVHTWHIEGDRCRQKQVDLLLTSCHDDEYTCDDGTCISKSRRCDLSVDCDDQSDEMNCEVVLVPSGYSAKLPPPTVMGQPLPIQFSLNITSIREFSLVSFTLSVDVFLRLVWQDRRLTFSNLQASHRANKVEEVEAVWTPVVKVEDGTKSVVQSKSHSEAVYVVQTAGPLPDDDTTIREDKRYSGSENMLIFQQEMTFTFKCHFRLQMYPFDRQRCYIIFQNSDMTTDYGVLTQDGPGVHFVGTRQLLEYTLLSETLTNYTENDISHLKISLMFRNQYGYYIGNTFLPSLMLVIICWATLNFDIADFEDRIMVSLTSLLVLATFFTQTSQGIPKTSYLKLIDIWFVALISEDFTIIVSLVYIETLRLKQPAAPIKVAPINSIIRKDVAAAPPPKLSSVAATSKAVKINRILLCIFSVTVLIMFLCFVSMCAFSALTH